MSGRAYILLYNGVTGGGGGGPTGTPITALVLGAKAPEAYRNTLRYATDVMMSVNGTEHRVALNLYPRETVEATYRMTLAEIQALRAAFTMDPGVTVLIAEEPEGLLATSAAVATTVSVDTTYSDVFTVGLPVLVRNAAEQTYTAYITAMSPGTPGVNALTLDQSVPGGQSYPAGYTEVIPLREVQIADSPTVNRYGLGDGLFTFRGDFTDVRSTFGTGVSLNFLDSLPILIKHAEREETHAEQTRADLQMLDFGGAFEALSERTRGVIRRSHQWTWQGQSERQYWKAFAQQILGQQGAFLMPTWLDDLTLSTQPGVSFTLVVASTPDYVGTWWAQGIDHIQVEYSNGTVGRFTVTAAVDNGNGTQSLSLSSSTSGATVSRISLLEVARLETDEIAFNWSSGLVCTMDLPILGVDA